jgi:hypothetical protein
MFEPVLRLIPPHYRRFALIVVALIAAMISAWQTYEILVTKSSCSDVGIHSPGKIDDALLLNNRTEDDCDER